MISELRDRDGVWIEVFSGRSSGKPKVGKESGGIEIGRPVKSRRQSPRQESSVNCRGILSGV